MCDNTGKCQTAVTKGETKRNKSKNCAEELTVKLQTLRSKEYEGNN